MMRLEGRAPAKLNLTLEVLGRRADGYHEVASIMHTLSLCDTLTLELPPPDQLDPAKGEIRVVEASDSPPLCEAIPTDSRNLVWQAVARFWEMLNLPPSLGFPPLREGNQPPSVPPACRGNLTEGVQASWHATLLKRIPSQAGLGGGSSDAALALRLLNQWAARYERALADDALYALASELGADVAFFLKGGCALATGRGERSPIAADAAPLLVGAGEALRGRRAYRLGVCATRTRRSQPERTSRPHRTPRAPAANHSHAPRPRPTAAQRLRHADSASHPRAGGAAHASGTGRRTARDSVWQRRGTSRPLRIGRPRQNPRKCAYPTELLGSSGAEQLIFREK
jgi:4-diphosphocytidyl-2C-methyl-D-erythritol kinase